MRISKWLSTLSVLAGTLCLAAAPAFARQDQAQQQTGDSVADAARKAREQQKVQPKPKKVFTDDDVKPASRADEAAQPAASGQTQAPDQVQNGSGEQTAGDKDKGGAGEKAQKDAAAVWKEKFADQRAKIAAAEKELDVLQREEQKAELQYYPDPQKALQEQFTRQDINDKLAKIDAKKEEIAKLKQQLDDMEEELRKSGGDPGWAREP